MKLRLSVLGFTVACITCLAVAIVVGHVARQARAEWIFESVGGDLAELSRGGLRLSGVVHCNGCLSILRYHRGTEAVILQDSNLESTDIDVLGGMQHVELIDLSGATFPAGSLESVMTLPSLRILKLSQCNITTDDLRSIWHLDSLAVLEISHIEVPKQMLDAIAAAPALRSIALRRCKIGAGTQLLWKKFDSCEELIISHSEIPEGTIDAIAMMPRLVYLDLTGAVIDRAGYSALSNLRDLVSLCIDSTQAAHVSKAVHSMSRLASVVVVGVNRDQVDLAADQLSQQSGRHFKITKLLASQGEDQ